MVPTLKSNLKAGTNLNYGTNLEVDTSFEAGTSLKLVQTWITYKEMFTLDTQPVSYCNLCWMSQFVTLRDFI